MCGIWLYVKHQSSNDEQIIDESELYESFLKIKSRGPEKSRFIKISNLNMYIGFHRLSIIDKSSKGDQPFMIETIDKHIIYTICNGEIYGYKYLKDKYNIQTYSDSDCEILPYLYIKIGITQLINELTSEHVSAEFAFIIIDINESLSIPTYNIYISRDPFGVRPLFMSENIHEFAFSSELKGLPLLNNSNVCHFPPSSYMTISFDGIFITKTLEKYFDITTISPYINDIEDAKKLIRDTLENSVCSRMYSDRKIAFLLSGGLDSSLVTAIGAKHAKNLGIEVITISIGMTGSTDEYYARLVSDYIGSTHYHVHLSEHEFLDAVDDVIKVIESYDITTVRASTGQYLVSKWIAKNTDIKVLYVGDGSDELFGGYLYFLKSPSPIEYSNEIIRLLQDIHMYDVLRTDRGIASNGIEARVPYLDHRLVQSVLSIDPSLRMPINNIEKWLLRESFKDSNLLPIEVLFRKKEAFSDGVSSLIRPWYLILQEKLNMLYTDDEFINYKNIYLHCPPPTKEALYYRQHFEQIYGHSLQTIIPYFWLPKWMGNIHEPSARILPVYS